MTLPEFRGTATHVEPDARRNVCSPPSSTILLTRSIGMSLCRSNWHGHWTRRIVSHAEKGMPTRWRKKRAKLEALMSATLATVASLSSSSRSCDVECRRAGASGDSAAVASIRQLSGLCELEDRSAFLPLKRHELGPELPRRLLGPSDAIDQGVDRARSERLASSKGLQASAVRYGYGRWIRFGGPKEKDLGKRPIRRSSTQSALWSLVPVPRNPLRLHVSEKKHRKRLGDRVLTGTELVPIYLRIGVELDAVVDSVVDQLRDIAHRITGAASD